jgi:ATP-dependent DNA helicase RecQ
MEGRDALALLPTGGGKSVCYQVPAVAMPGFCLVITPLVALMQDQVRRLEELGIPAACIHAGMPYPEVLRTLENMVHGPFKLLYISPERLQSGVFREFLPDFNISFLAVDEAHCISQWGHDFRPDYLKIAWLREVFTDIPILALTATATHEIQKDIFNYLNLKDPETFQSSFKRSNIFYDIRYSENKAGDTLRALTKEKGSSIIYCRSRKQTETVAKNLNDHGIPALAYHAGMHKDKRDRAQQAWMSNEARVMVATTAFGMGIDKGDVRLVLHYDAPENPESFYQEAGRAGRDGKPALSMCLYNTSDIRRLEESTQLLFPPEAYLRQVYQSVAEYLQIPVTAEPDKYYPFDLAAFASRFKLQAVPASNALKLLEKEALWTLSDSVFNPAAIQFIADRHELEEVSRTYPDLLVIITGLLRLYGTLFHYLTPIRLSTIAKQLRLKQETVELMLLQLERMELIEYQRPREGAHMYFHHRRVESSHLLLDVERIHRLRTSHEKKTRAIIEFLTLTTTCRERYLLEYFEEATTADCGHCDVCAQKRRQTNKPGELRQALLELLNGPPLNLQTIVEAMDAWEQDKIIQVIRSMMDEGKILNNEAGLLFLKP